MRIEHLSRKERKAFMLGMEYGIIMFHIKLMDFPFHVKFLADNKERVTDLCRGLQYEITKVNEDLCTLFISGN